jgi:carbon-monoxide dehydrogenase small subunit
VSHDLPPAQEHRVDIAMTVNGRLESRRVPTTMRLLQFLRDELGLTGAKEVCAEGECGACTVLMDGRAVLSCLILAVEAQGAEIVTVEGLEHPVKAALAQTHAVQCGYCFPGMVVSAAAFLDTHPAPTREQIKAGLAGNLCRCTGYVKILDAVELAARRAAPAATAKGRDA